MLCPEMLKAVTCKHEWRYFLMNDDVFTGQWTQLRGSLKSWWGRLTDDDLDRIGGQKDRLVGLVQEKYGQSREQAEREVEQRLREYGDGGGIGAKLKAGASQFGSNISNKAKEASGAVSSRVDSARAYLQDRSGNELLDDVVDAIQRYPVYASFVGFGVGYILGKGVSGAAHLERLGRQKKDELLGLVGETYHQTRAAAGRQAEQFSDSDMAAKLKAGASELRTNLSKKAGEAVERLSPTMESARSYVRDTNLDEFAGDLRNVIRKYPIYACLVALAVGVLAKGGVGSRDRYQDRPDW
jgi:uncharacterized protein YjbJ (UPF0337 family)